jgi:hypothetical protein
MIQAALWNFGLNGEITMQVDSESSMLSIMEKVAAKRKAKTFLRKNPKELKQSNACVEAAHRALDGLSRCYKHQIESNCNVTILMENEILHMFTYESSICMMGEAVMLKLDHEEVLRAKYTNNWVECIWLGRDYSDDRHIGITEYGSIRSRSCRRFPVNYARGVNEYRVPSTMTARSHRSRTLEVTGTVTTGTEANESSNAEVTNTKMTESAGVMNTEVTDTADKFPVGDRCNRDLLLKCKGTPCDRKGDSEKEFANNRPYDRPWHPDHHTAECKVHQKAWINEKEKKVNVIPGARAEPEAEEAERRKLFASENADKEIGQVPRDGFDPDVKRRRVDNIEQKCNG